MSRVFWDTMLFIYLLEEHPVYAPRVEHLRKRHLQRGDQISTCYLALGELLVGAYKSSDSSRAGVLRDAFLASNITLLHFNFEAAERFGQLRAEHNLSTADAIHLSCASAAKTDLFLTADKRLTKLTVPGIHFIADINTDLL